MSSSTLQAKSIWDTNKKNMRFCAGCLHECDACILMGGSAYHNTPYNLFFVFERPTEAFDIAQQYKYKSAELVNVLTRLGRVLDRKEFTADYSMAYGVAAPGTTAPSANAARLCSKYLNAKMIAAANAVSRIPVHNPTNVAVAFGTGALQSLNIKGVSAKSARGKVHDIRIGPVQYKVLPTLSLRELYVNPNVLELIIGDVSTALGVLFENYTPRTIQEISEPYIIPQTLPEVRDLCDHVIEYSGKKSIPPEKWPIALDTETTGLNPWFRNQRVIMMSVAWDDAQSGAIALDHKEVPYNPVEAWKHVERLCACLKPKILHNMKFDFKWLLYVAGVEMVNPWWDTMMGEHFLNENAKGFYGLKALAVKYAPQYAGYEAQLKKLLQEVPDGLSVETFVQYTTAAMRGIEFDDYELHMSEDLYTQLCLETAMATAESKNFKNLKKRRDKCRQRIRAGYLKEGYSKEEIPDTGKIKEVKSFQSNTAFFEQVPLNVLAAYAAVDTDLTRVICKEQRQLSRRSRQLSIDNHRVMSDLYIPGTLSLGRMEQRGIRIDLDLVQQYIEEITDFKKIYEDKIFQILCTDEYNLRSTKQLGSIFTDVFGLDWETLPKTEKGALKTDKSVINQFKVQYAGQPLGDFCHYLLVYRSCDKAINTYLKSILTLSAVDGRIHTQFNLNGTATGRLSSSKPNFQNLPAYMVREIYKNADGSIRDQTKGWSIKRLLIPTSPEWAMFNCDISAAEVRVLCAYLGDDPLVDAVRNGMDVPSFITARVFGANIYELRNEHFKHHSYDEDRDFDEVYAFIAANKEDDSDIKFMRTACKRVLYGTLYGAGAAKIAEQIYGGLSHDPIEKMEQIDFATKVQHQFFTMFPAIERYIGDTSREVTHNKEVASLFGRRRRFPLADRRSRYHLSKAKREAVNFKIQSCASDLVLSQLCEVEEAIAAIQGRLLLTVHDSMMGEIKKENVPLLRAFFDEWIVARVKKKFPWLPVAYTYGLEVGINYHDLVPMEKIESGELDPSQQAICETLGIGI